MAMDREHRRLLVDLIANGVRNLAGSDVFDVLAEVFDELDEKDRSPHARRCFLEARSKLSVLRDSCLRFEAIPEIKDTEEAQEPYHVGR